MRRLVVAAIVALLALSLTGCGGKKEEAAAPAADANASAVPTATATSKADDPNPIADRSAESTQTSFEVSTIKSLPDEITENLANKQAMILFFYNGDQKVTDDARKQVEKVANDNTGMVNLIEYNLGKATSVDSAGAITVDPSVLKDDEKLAAAISLARELKVTGTPYTVVIDDQGLMIFTAKGYLDAGLLDRQIERAAQ